MVRIVLVTLSANTRRAEPPAREGEHRRRRRSDGRRLRRRRIAEPYAPEHEEDEKKHGRHAGQAANPLAPGRALLGRRDQAGRESHAHPDIGHEDERHQDARQHARDEEPLHGLLDHRPVDDHGDAGRDQDAQSPARGQAAEENFRLVAAPPHLGDGHGPDGGRRRHARAAHRREDGAGHDIGLQEPAFEAVEPRQAHAPVEVFAQPRAQDELAHQDEERHRGQHEALDGVPADIAQGGERRRPTVQQQHDDPGESQAERYPEPQKQQYEQQPNHEKKRDFPAHGRLTAPCAPALPARRLRLRPRGRAGPAARPAGALPPPP